MMASTKANRDKMYMCNERETKNKDPAMKRKRAVQIG